ncbi:MAG: EAL domain-containing protein [Alphaproteobacteria bacterium]|nr:EAL domain-containing protein [Alphaproteobacteria bacterium]MDP3533063.1 EAL domain-containing protein [Alphaproteobacteria bacterium]
MFSVQLETMPKPRWSQGIRAKLFVTVSFILITIGALALSFFIFVSYTEKLNSLNQRATLLTEMQSASLAFPLWNLNNDQINALIAILSKDEDFKGAKVIGTKQDEIAFKGVLPEDNDLRFKKDIIFNEFGKETRIGTLELYISTARLWEEVKNSFYWGCLVLFLMNLLIFIGLLFALSGFVLTPLRRMMFIMEKVAKGALDQRVVIKTKDEFGLLASIFNKMTNEIEGMYRTIEQKVNERTTELVKSNADMVVAQQETTEALKLLQIEKEKSERLFADALEISPAALVLVDASEKILRWNKRFIDLDPINIEPMIKQGINANLVFSKMSDDTTGNIRLQLHQDSKKSITSEQKLTNGRWVRVSEHKTRDHATALMLVDITDIKEREQKLEIVNTDLALQTEKLKDSEEKYSLAAHGANDGLWDCNVKTGHIYLSIRYKEMIGYNEDEEVFSTLEGWYERVHPDHLVEFKRAFEGHLKGDIPRFKAEYLMKHRDGSYHWMLSRGLAARDKDGIVFRLAGSQTDITMQKNYEQELIHTAYHDPLTGLPNREYFIRRLKECLDEIRAHSIQLTAVLFLDLDRFKVVNDSLGHDVGDKLLIGIGQRLKACLRDNDFAARLGGDEFTAILRNIPDLEEAKAVSGRILDSLAEPFHLNGNDVFASASIGITLLNDKFEDTDSLLRNADLAMYRAKSRGRARYEIFDQELHNEVMTELHIETELRRAIEKEEICFFYQPIIDLSSNELFGFEGLIRWQSKNEMIGLDRFLHIAEETGLILPMGEYIFKLGCEQLKSWLELIGADYKISLSINLSARQIKDFVYMQKILEIIRSYDFPAGLLKIEITESAIMDDLAQTNWVLDQIKELGVSLCIDDFGTGYSSFSYLHKFPFDYLKIDHSFTHNMMKNEKTYSLIRGIVSLSHDLGLLVVAEGIEEEDELDHLKRLKCDYGQGFYYARALPPAEATQLILDSKLSLTEEALIRDLSPAIFQAEAS